MRARLQDLTWLWFRDVKAAESAIGSYLDAANERPDGPVSGDVRYLRRALALSRTPGLKTANASEISRKIVTIIEASSSFNERALYAITRVLLETKDCDKAALRVIAERGMRQSAASARSCTEFGRARGLYSSARAFADLVRRLSDSVNDKAGGATAKFENASLLLDEIALIEKVYRDNPVAGSLLARHLYEQAIKALQETDKGRQQVDDVIRRFQASAALLAVIFRRADEQSTAMKAMSQEEVEGLPLYGFLGHFAFAALPLSHEFLSQNLKELRSRPSICNILRPSSLDIDRRGRTKASADPHEAWDADGADSQALFDMDQNARIYRDCVVTEIIFPALTTFVGAHTADGEEILNVLRGSAFVPDHALPIWTLGVQLGLTGNILLALHVLIPQAENSIRELLNAGGVITASIKSLGVENEASIEEMFGDERRPVLEARIGADEVHDLRLLLTRKPAGLNLRNRLAHGLAEPMELDGGQAWYLFWLLLRIVFKLRPECAGRPGQ
jgi:hypothetical protein